MNEIDEFYNYIKNELNNIDFKKIYSDILNNNLYKPTDLINAIYLIIYLLEHDKHLKPETTSVLNYYLNILVNDKINKYQLLYITQMLYNLSINNKDSPTGYLYM